MTYKEKKLKEFEEFCLDKGVLFIDRKMMAGFLYETIDEIMACLPKQKAEPELADYDVRYNVGFNVCLRNFLQNLEEKAGEL